MVDDTQKITCPKCGEIISIDDALTHQIREKLEKGMQEKQKRQEIEIEEAKKELEKEKSALEEAQKNVQIEINKKVEEKLSQGKAELWKKALEEANKRKTDEMKLLEEDLRQKDEKLREANAKELEIRKEKNILKEKMENLELEKQRQLDEEREKIVQSATKKANEEQQHVIAQLNKKLDDAIKAKDDLARKLEQGSQQTQGEVLELELEALLRAEFPFDEIIPVPKGENGADIIHKVIDSSGRECGQIVWESKKTKTWNNAWIQKLKDDQRLAKADLAVIVSIALPEDVAGFVTREGVWICDLHLVIALATALRMNLQAIAREKAMAVGKNEKMEILYAYLTGVEFKQRVEAIVEAFTSMDVGIKKERLAFEKIWAEREKQIKKVLTNTIGMYGDLSGLVTLPQIKLLELEEVVTQE